LPEAIPQNRKGFAVNEFEGIRVVNFGQPIRGLAVRICVDTESRLKPDARPQDYAASRAGRRRLSEEGRGQNPTEVLRIYEVEHIRRPREQFEAKQVVVTGSCRKRP